MESDKKLDKLESFLGRLNNKGMYAFRQIPPLLRIDFIIVLGPNRVSLLFSGRSAGNHHNSY